MTPEAGAQIGEWTVASPHAGERPNEWFAHRTDTPWRKVLLRPLGAEDPADVAAKIDALTSLDHPHLEPLVGLAEHEGHWFVVTERRHGIGLPKLHADTHASRSFALHIGLAVTQAVWFAHQHGVTHGQLEPDQIWLSETGTPLVIGWFAEPHATAASDVTALAKLLTWLFEEVRLGLSAVEDWVAAADDDPATVSVADLRRSLTQLHDEILGRTTPALTPREAESTFFDDTDDGSPDASPRMPHQIGRYVIVREIGRGGAGVVYEAIDPDLQRHVAVKVLLAGDFAQARDQQRFLNEARAVAQLDHPHIVKILELDRHEGRAWYAMDLVEGPNLLQHLRTKGRLPWRTAVRLAASLAQALHHAHGQGLVHRDVKPNNVLLEADLEPRLTDFGLALFTGESAHSRLTRTGQVLGTPSYMSPEQANGELHRIGPSTDVYGVGVVLYEALTGEVPFRGDRPLSIIAAVVEGRVTPPRQLVSGIPRQVQHTVLKAMQVDPMDRYPDAQQLAEDLERCLRGEPIVAAPPTLGDQLRWFIRRNRTEVGILATTLGIVLLILVGSTAVVGARSVRQTNLVEAEAETALHSVMARIEELESEGRVEEAEQSWQTFARRPAHRGTQALVAGWWWRAEHLAGLGDEPGQIAALGMAFASAERSLEQEQALLRLATEVRQQGRLERLPRIVETLQGRSPRLSRSPELRLLMRDAFLSERRVDEAFAVAESPEASVLRALGQATRTGHRATRAIPWTGPDGALLLWSEDVSPLVVDAAANLPVVRRFEGVNWGGDQVVLPTNRRGTFWIGNEGNAALVGLRAGRLTQLRSYAGGPLRAATLAPIGAGTGLTPILALGERIVQPIGAGRGIRDLHPATSAAGSSVTDLVVADLNGDGTSEIAAALGEWNAYDIRIFEREGREARLVAHRKLGVVTDLAVLPNPDGTASLIANKVDRAPNPEVFGRAQPHGEARGLWQLSRSGHQLTATRLASTPCDELQVGDLDGDGDADLAAQCGEDLGLWIRTGEELRSLAIRQLDLVTLSNLDDDAAIELVVHTEGNLWVLGAGDGALPVLQGKSWIEAPPPNGASPAFREAWQRAEELAFIGQLKQAADAMEQLAELHWGEPEGWAATLRAASLHDAAGRPVHGGQLALRAASALDGLERVAALHAAASAWQDAREPARELEVLEQLRDLGALDRTDVARLRSLQEVAARPEFELDLTASLTPEWHVDQPLALQQEPGGGLRVEGFGHQTLAHVPVEWDGGPLVLDVTLSVDRVEWDGGLEVGLVPAGTAAPLYGLEVIGEAGPAGVVPMLRCRAGGEARATELSLGESRTARFQLLDKRGFGCSFADEDGFRQGSGEPIGVMGFGKWDLVVRASGAHDTSIDATVQRIKVSGASLDPEATNGDATRLTFANGRVYDAQEALQGGPPDPLLAVAIAAERGDGEALRKALRGSVRPQLASVLAHLLHCRLEALATDLQRILGDEFTSWFALAWDTALSQQQPSPALASALLSALDGLENTEPTTVEDRQTWIRLAAFRGRAALAKGDLELADRSFTLALQRFDQLRTQDRASDAVAALRSDIATLHLDRATLAIRNDEPIALALDAIRAGLLWAPDPLSMLDRAAVRRELAPLQSSELVQQWRTALRTGQRTSFGSVRSP
ncbi:MAG: serine/threonine-protein kinase [Myxococcota bacterium]